MSAVTAASPEKKTKIADGEACVVDDATIPVHGVTRMIHLKVAGEVSCAVLCKVHV